MRRKEDNSDDISHCPAHLSPEGDSATPAELPGISREKREEDGGGESDDSRDFVFFI